MKVDLIPNICGLSLATVLNGESVRNLRPLLKTPIVHNK